MSIQCFLSLDMAIDDWVRCSGIKRPSRASMHKWHRQFHCGKPPPAAEPSTYTYNDKGLIFSEIHCYDVRMILTSLR